MLNLWLQESTRSEKPGDGFVVTDIVEVCAPTDVIRAHLRELLVAERLDKAFLETANQYLGSADLQAIIDGAVPSSVTMRRGCFGEALSASVLSQLRGFTIPVRKFQYALTSNQSLPGTDLLAIRFTEDEITEVRFVESKLRTTCDKSAATLGYRQLGNDMARQVPSLLVFIAKRLHETSDQLFDRFMRYLASRADTSDRETYSLFLVWSADAWHEDVLGNLKEEGVKLSPLDTTVVLIGNLKTLTAELFDGIGVETIIDDA